MIHLNKQRYEYLEEVNEGILNQIKKSNDASKTVLDVGCGYGALSYEIKKLGYTVYGIEGNTAASEKAGTRIDKIINMDLTDIEKIKDELCSTKFDIIIFSDVLEHLYDPFNIVVKYIGFLKPGGQIIISVPNIAVWSKRLKLLFGDFRYTDTGVLDRTHIRFFTFKSASELILSAGLKIEKTDYTPYIIRAFLPIIKKIYLKEKNVDGMNVDGINVDGIDKRQILDSSGYRIYLKYVYPLEYFLGYLFKRLFAFRIIIVAKMA